MRLRWLQRIVPALPAITALVLAGCVTPRQPVAEQGTVTRIASVEFSPDGNKLALSIARAESGFSRELVVIDLHTKKAITVGQSLPNPSWRSHEEVAYLSPRPRISGAPFWALTIYNLTLGSSQPLEGFPSWPLKFAFSPDGEHAAWVDDDNFDLWFSDAQGANRQRVCTWSWLRQDTLQWSRSGNMLYFRGIYDGDQAIGRVNAKPVRCAPPLRLQDTPLMVRASADAQTFVYRTERSDKRAMLVVATSDASGQRDLVLPDGQTPLHFDCSPSGIWCLTDTEEGDMYLIHLPTGDATKIGRGIYPTWSLSADDTFIYITIKQFSPRDEVVVHQHKVHAGDDGRYSTSPIISPVTVP